MRTLQFAKLRLTPAASPFSRSPLTRSRSLSHSRKHWQSYSGSRMISGSSRATCAFGVMSMAEQLREEYMQVRPTNLFSDAVADVRLALTVTGLYTLVGLGIALAFI